MQPIFSCSLLLKLVLMYTEMTENPVFQYFYNSMIIKTWRRDLKSAVITYHSEHGFISIFNNQIKSCVYFLLTCSIKIHCRFVENKFFL
jgi:alpha-amylase/alpha-mannosidase (GH57 family)